MELVAVLGMIITKYIILEKLRITEVKEHMICSGISIANYGDSTIQQVLLLKKEWVWNLKTDSA